MKPMDETTLDRPEVGTGFSVICLFLSVETSPSFVEVFL